MYHLLQRIIQLIDSQFMVGLRVAMIGYVCLMCFFVSVESIHAQFPNSRQVETQLQDEHRFSVLETKMDHLTQSMDYMQKWKLLEMLALSGLLGERGYQIVKSKIVPKLEN